jgi:hypothetical protein
MVKDLSASIHESHAAFDVDFFQRFQPIAIETRADHVHPLDA